jgi:WD40 repeat protein
VEEAGWPVASWLRGLDMDPSGERVVALHRKGALEVFELKSGRSLLKLDGPFEKAAFSAPNRLVAISRPVGTAEAVEDQLVLLDATTGVSLHSVTNHFRVSALAVSPDGKCVAIGGSDQSVHLFESGTLAHRFSFRAHDGEITALRFHPTLPIIASGAMDRSVKLWEHDTARQLDRMLGFGGTPVVLAFNPSGRLLLVDGEEPMTRVFDVTAAVQLADPKSRGNSR